MWLHSVLANMILPHRSLVPGSTTALDFMANCPLFSNWFCLDSYDIELFPHWLVRRLSGSLLPRQPQDPVCYRRHDRCYDYVGWCWASGRYGSLGLADHGVHPNIPTFDYGCVSLPVAARLEPWVDAIHVLEVSCSIRTYNCGVSAFWEKGSYGLLQENVRQTRPLRKVHM
jgi:hypothetical protein